MLSPTRISRTVLAVCLALLAGGMARSQEPEEEEQDNPLARADWFYQQRALPGTQIPAGARLRALAELRRLAPATTVPATARPGARAATPLSGSQWTNIGPAPIGIGPNARAGRVTAIAVDPRNKDVVYAGVSEGGVWKSKNGGQTWLPLTDNEVSMAVGSIAIDPQTPDTLYVGTGEANNSGDSYYGAGILKSTDGGASWTNIPGPFTSSTGGAKIGALAVNPFQSNVLVAGVSFGASSGIWRSADAGATWAQALSGLAGSDVAFDPAHDGVVYAALGANTVSTLAGVYKSTDAGVTWTRLQGTGASTLPAANVGRIALAIAPSDTQVLLASIAKSSTDGTNGSLLGLFKSTDAGLTWRLLPGTPGFCNNICWYANVVRFNPANSNVLYAGGGAGGLYGSSDGGATWRKADSYTTGGSRFALHVDHHALTFSADGSRLYDGNDGGIWSTEDVAALPATWTNLNATLATALFNPSFSISPADPNIAYGGTQDNSTLRFNGGPSWNPVTCGDGGWTVMDPALPDLPYTSCQNVSFFKGPPGGSGFWLPVTHGLNTNDPSQFYPPVAIDPNTGLRIYFGTNKLYQTLDGAGLWTPVANAPTLAAGTTLTAISVSPANPGRVWVGTNNGSLWVVDGVLTASPVWTLVITSLPKRYITQIAPDAGDADVAYVTFSGFSGVGGNGHVFVTRNVGVSWRDISPPVNTPVNDIVIDPQNLGTLYLATDSGVLRSTDAGNTWSPFGTGLPNVVVQALRLHRGARILRAATHGRSMWDIGVPVNADAATAPAITKLIPQLLNAGAAAQTVEIDGAGFTSTSTVLWNGEARASTFVSATKLTVAIPASDIATPGRAAIAVANAPAQGGLSSPANLDIGPAPAVTSNGIVSSATGLAGAFSPGSIITIYGSNLASGISQAANADLPLTLGNLSITIAGSSAPLFFVSPGQVNLQIPWFVTGRSAAVNYTTGDLKGASTTVNLATYSPSLYAINSQGTGQGSILIANTTSLAGPAGIIPGAQPVSRGDFIEIYATGLGPVSPSQGSGVPAPTSPLAKTQATPVVTIDGQAGQVSFAGLTPGTVGLYQIDVKVPDSVQPGNAVPVKLTIGGVDSNVVTIAVQ